MNSEVRRLHSSLAKGSVENDRLAGSVKVAGVIELASFRGALVALLFEDRAQRTGTATGMAGYTTKEHTGAGPIWPVCTPSRPKSRKALESVDLGALYVTISERYEPPLRRITCINW